LDHSLANDPAESRNLLLLSEPESRFLDFAANIRKRILLLRSK
jgi:hypothetical protein